MRFTLKGPGLHHVSTIESVFGGKSVSSCKIFLLRYIVRTNLKKEEKKRKSAKIIKKKKSQRKKAQKENKEIMTNFINKSICR